MKVDNLMLNIRKVYSPFLIYYLFCQDKLIEIIEKIPGILFN